MSEVNLKPVDTSAEWGHLPTATREEIDIFETELRQIQAGLVDEKIFTEFRLRHGVYGTAPRQGPDAAHQDPDGADDRRPIGSLG